MLDYDKICEGTSYYKTTSETYTTNIRRRKIKKIVKRKIKNSKKFKVLDLGCYIGTDLFMLSLDFKNAKFYGLDISKNAIKRAKELAKFRKAKNIKFNIGNLNDKIPYKDNFFDVIICSEVIEHLKNPESFLKKCHSKLKKEGLLIITTPNNDYPFVKLGRLINVKKHREYEFKRMGVNVSKKDWDEEGHISLMKNKELVNLLKKNKFKIETNEGVSIFGGNSFFDKHLTFLGLMIFIDSFLNRFKSLCSGMIISAKKVK